ncbi:response regulator [Futiania mangrovi]|uniref:Response regulator n=1 Tax=Futiania mangrovi TaxID=2959716 RepID=A0A9J6PAT2_9PROT|nr:response regulator [Futiania mangrovii]MCP1335553.1 response regulator [Futiania mangrovii]
MTTSTDRLDKKAHPFDIFVGTKIKLLRKKKGLSQTALARALGITFQQVQKYERGDNRVSVSRLYDISKVLDVSLAVLVSGFDVLEAGMLGTGAEKEEVENLLDQLRSDEILRLIEHYSEIEDPGVRRSIVSQVEALARAAMKERRGSERVLVVEDDPLVRNHVAATLETLGYGVRTCVAAEDAMSVARGDEPFDLLFTDIVLPGRMNGIELASEIRTLRPNVRVLFTTGFANDAVNHETLTGSKAILLLKPYRKRKLADMVRIALEDWPGA